MDEEILKRIEVMLGEFARLIKDGEANKALAIAESVLEEISSVKNKSVAVQILLEFVNMIPHLGEKARDLLLKSVETIREKIDFANDSDKYIFAKFLAVISHALFEIGKDPSKFLNEAERILYDLAIEKGFVREYAAFINLYYAPILNLLGQTKKAIKSLEVATDELFYHYRTKNDELSLALYAEINAYKARLFYEIGDITTAKKLLEDSLDIFLKFNDTYKDHIIAICRNLLDLYSEIGEIGEKIEICKKYILEF